MRVRDFSAPTALVLVALLAACSGGGGGSGGGGQTGGSAPTGGTPPGDTGSTGGQTSGGTGPSSAKVVFPWKQSGALGPVVTVRGTASDPDGVAHVRVNGVAASLSPAPSSPSSAKPAGPTASKALGSAPRAASDATVLADAAPTDVEWSSEVQVQPGDNDVVVEVEDGGGEVTTDADRVEIKYAEVPRLFTADPADPRLLGWSYTLTPSGYVQHLVQYDDSTGGETVYPQLTDVGIASCFKSTTNEFLYLMLVDADAWQLRSFDLTAGTSRIVSDIPPDLLTAGAGITGPLLMQLACDGAHDDVYLLANYWKDGNAVDSRILRIDASGAASILTETDPAESPLWLAYKIALSEDSLISVRDINPVAPLTRISLADGSRSVLAPTLDVGALALAAALPSQHVYATTFDGVDEVSLADPPSRHNLSPVGPADPLIFSQADSIALDSVQNRVIVGDSDLDELIGVDLVTGERSELLSRKIGAGPPLIVPRRLALTAAGDTVYVADDGQNAAEKLFAVDLATGDKRVIGQINEAGVNRSLTGLALDEQNGRAYVSRYDGGTVLEVDLDTESVAAITSSGDGLLENINDLLLDADNHRLLAADAGTDAIVAVDLATHEKQLVSRAGERGDGQAFSTLVSLTMAEDGKSVYAADQATNQILRVDLETGDRSVVETTCSLTEPETLHQVLYDAADHELLIVADGIFVFDLGTSACTQIPTAVDPLDIRLMQDGRILAADFNAVTQVDRETGDVVIVSK